MASRKDYVAEATAIHDHLIPTVMDTKALLGFIGERADYYQQGNEAFDRERFFAACLRGPKAAVRRSIDRA